MEEALALAHRFALALRSDVLSYGLIFDQLLVIDVMALTLEPAYNSRMYHVTAKADICWGSTDYLTAGVIDAINTLTWVTAGAPRNHKPQPVNRPDDNRKARAEYQHKRSRLLSLNAYTAKDPDVIKRRGL